MTTSNIIDVPETAPDRPQPISWCGEVPIPIFKENSVSIDLRGSETIRCLLTDLTRYYQEAEAVFDFYEEQ